MNKAQSNVAANVGEIISKFLVPRDDYFEGEIVEYLTHQGWARTPGGSLDSTAPMMITTSGKIYAEALIAEGVEVLDLIDWVDDQDVQNLTKLQVPAADRIVPLNHNEPEYLEINEKLGELATAVLGDNELNPEEKSRISGGLAAAKAVWNGLEIKAIQYKVGVLMAVEDVKPVAKAKFYELLVDALIALVRAFAKRLGLNLDLF
nr:hypothetical protein [uncultured Sphingorhabdus sp.]